jgi:hypothetical protein
VEPVEIPPEVAPYEAKRLRYAASKARYTTSAQLAMLSGVEKKQAFHHYFKKNMTILGLSKSLDSSDSDSESDSNYKSKVFRRRWHYPFLAAKKEAPPLENEKKTHRETRWAYRAPSIADVGVYEDDPEHPDRLSTVAAKRAKGTRFSKRIFPGAIRDGRNVVEDFRKNNRAPARLSALDEYVTRSRSTADAQCCLPNEWDAREEQKRLERIARKQRGPGFDPNAGRWGLSPVEQTRARIAEERAQSTGPDGRSGGTISAMTEGKICRRADELLRDGRESLARHRLIMDVVRSSVIPKGVDS